MLNFTNISRSIDTFLNKFSLKKQRFILLILSGLSSNFDFSNSKKLQDNNFYNNSFLMSSLNIFSLVSIEILLLTLFISSSLNYMLPYFILTNFFVIIWFGKKLLDIYKDNYCNFSHKNDISNFNTNTTKQIKEFEYDNKYNITKNILVIAIVINIIVALSLYFIGNLFIFLAINLFFLLSFFELFAYSLYIIANNNHINELTFYSGLVSSYSFSISHLLFLFLSLILLKTNIILYTNLLIANQVLTLEIFLLLIAFSSILCLFSKTYTFVFTFIFPLSLLFTHNNPIFFSFFISFCLLIIFYLNIISISNAKYVLIEFITILIGGILTYFILFHFGLLIAYLFVFIYLIFFFFFYDSFFPKGQND